MRRPTPALAIPTSTTRSYPSFLRTNRDCCTAQFAPTTGPKSTCWSSAVAMNPNVSVSRSESLSPANSSIPPRRGSLIRARWAITPRTCLSPSPTRVWPTSEPTTRVRTQNACLPTAGNWHQWWRRAIDLVWPMEISHPTLPTCETTEAFNSISSGLHPTATPGMVARRSRVTPMD